jgi:Protein of unknown function, DUF547
MKIVLNIIFFTSILSNCFAFKPQPHIASPVSHDIFDKLLKKYVSESGFVNYGGFKKEEKELKKYLDILSSNAPQKSWSTEDKLSFWINAYNAFTIQLILDHQDKGLKSIKDIGDKIKIPFVNTPWDIKFITIGGKKMDLNNIEHGIIRKQFKEPRIHFALVCAAVSCPALLNEAYDGSKLNEQLNRQGVVFFNDNQKNEVTKTTAKLSKIMDWYGGDFKNGTIIEWVNKFVKNKANLNATITYKNYDWALNGKF